MLTEYERLGLPWRHALGALALVSVVGGDEPEVRELAGTAREIFARLGARPFLARLDEALAHASARTGQPRPARESNHGRVAGTGRDPAAERHGP